MIFSPTILTAILATIMTTTSAHPQTGSHNGGQAYIHSVIANARSQSVETMPQINTSGLPVRYWSVEGISTAIFGADEDLFVIIPNGGIELLKSMSLQVDLSVTIKPEKYTSKQTTGWHVIDRFANNTYNVYNGGYNIVIHASRPFVGCEEYGSMSLSTSYRTTLLPIGTQIQICIAAAGHQFNFKLLSYTIRVTACAYKLADS
jgi:hypothetical protein